MPRFSDPEPLQRSHQLEGFDSGRASLDRWLCDHALPAMRSDTARTSVITDSAQGGRVVGYYAISSASLTRKQGSPRAAKGQPRHAIPAVLLARLAVDASVQQRGVGAFLLGDAITRTVAAAEQVGIRVLLVHAIDDQARAFYERFGFESSVTDPLHLMLLMKDARASVAEAAG